jgi:hypothetical protein
MDYASLLDNNFLKLIGLRERIPFQIVPELRDENGYPFTGGAYLTENRIEIRAGLTGNQFLTVYMHEVAHFIASNAGIDDTLYSQNHTAYFATLVAVMYRRSKDLHKLKVYDFADSNIGDAAVLENGVIVSDDDLIKRFRYIIKRSAYYAPTSMTIEEIASDIYERDVRPQFDAPVRIRKPSKPISWLDVGIGSMLGAGFVGCLSMAVAVLKFS